MHPNCKCWQCIAFAGLDKLKDQPNANNHGDDFMAWREAFNGGDNCSAREKRETSYSVPDPPPTQHNDTTASPGCVQNNARSDLIEDMTRELADCKLSENREGLQQPQSSALGDEGSSSMKMGPAELQGACGLGATDGDRVIDPMYSDYLRVVDRFEAFYDQNQRRNHDGLQQSQPSAGTAIACDINNHYDNGWSDARLQNLTSMMDHYLLRLDAEVDNQGALDVPHNPSQASPQQREEPHNNFDLGRAHCDLGETQDGRASAEAAIVGDEGNSFMSMGPDELERMFDAKMSGLHRTRVIFPRASNAFRNVMNYFVTQHEQDDTQEPQSPAQTTAQLSSQTGIFEEGSELAEARDFLAGAWENAFDSESAEKKALWLGAGLQDLNSSGLAAHTPGNKGDSPATETKEEKKADNNSGNGVSPSNKDGGESARKDSSSNTDISRSAYGNTSSSEKSAWDGAFGAVGGDSGLSNGLGELGFGNSGMSSKWGNASGGSGWGNSTWNDTSSWSRGW